MDRFDFAVLGAGPAGHFGAIQAAKAGHKVVVIEELARLGGHSTSTGTIPSKALREAVLSLGGVRQRALSGENYSTKEPPTFADLAITTDRIIANENAVFGDQLRRNGVTLLRGHGSFVAPHQLVCESTDGVRVLEAEKILIATGSRPARPPGLDFDGRYVLDSSQILRISAVPRRLIVVGAGVIGVEYACIFAALGCIVTLVNDRHDFLDFADRQIVELLKHQMSRLNIDFRFGEKVTDLQRANHHVVARTASNKSLVGDCVLYCAGRQGNTEQLNLETTGLEADTRGRIKVDDNMQTAVPGLYAAGDVVGFPALAATSREQGRRAACHALGIGCPTSNTLLPYGIYSIPEVSMIGPTEQELTVACTPYEVGRARYREIARGQILGDTDGMLKLLFDPRSLRLLAVHAIGEGATELIHIGQAVHSHGGTLDYFADAVFNYPTLAECYKVAALDGINRAQLAARCLRASKCADVAAPSDEVSAPPVAAAP
ncbi:MAG: Si-specific NAD(P)(+) transhydrogenase [Planctomycetota bacterium]